MEKLLKEVRFLKIYSLTLTAVLAFFIFMSFRADYAKQRFQEIDVERINVREKDGTIRLVLSNAERQHPGAMDGKENAPRRRQAGLLFFNDQGDECGGLVYGADKKEGAGMVYSVDQYKNDQIMQLQYSQDMEGKDKQRSYGLKMWDRSDDFPIAKLVHVFDSLEALKNEAVMNAEVKKLRDAGLLPTERLFVGKTVAGSYGLFIRDEKGKPRIKIYIDKNNQAKLEVLDENGKVVPQ
ncbi:hypothetical protein [Chitinophaga solisilvae]|uniref:hypothetical protein n=1 Tax=Chitinophaga solisilvae TaxID=1233460 RepID=UPI0013716722|nr:hypothetical protein [Chitinophaga solisilvae]